MMGKVLYENVYMYLTHWNLSLQNGFVYNSNAIAN